MIGALRPSSQHLIFPVYFCHYSGTVSTTQTLVRTPDHVEGLQGRVSVRGTVRVRGRVRVRVRSRVRVWVRVGRIRED